MTRAAVAKATGENDKFLWGFVPTITILAWVDYVIAPSHYERSFGYAQDDTALGAACLAAGMIMWWSVF
jgi:hypothetical protein